MNLNLHARAHVVLTESPRPNILESSRNSPLSTGLCIPDRFFSPPPPPPLRYYYDEWVRIGASTSRSSLASVLRVAPAGIPGKFVCSLSSRSLYRVLLFVNCCACLVCQLSPRVRSRVRVDVFLTLLEYNVIVVRMYFDSAPVLWLVPYLHRVRVIV